MGKFTFRIFFIIFFFSLFNKKSGEVIAQVTTMTFNATGGNQTFVVPPCVNSLTVQAWGGAGGGGGWDSYAGSPGGGGAYATSVLAVTSGTSLTIIVGVGGTQGGPCAGSGPGGPGGFGLGSGGNGGSSGSGGCSGPGGGGGGGTGIKNGATILIVAGGGGGGGGGGNHGGGSPAGGGGQAGQPGGSSAANGILGASGSTSGLNGSNAGGADGAGGGGGGGGLVGGGGGHTPPTDNGGSGGAGGTSQGTTINNGNLQTPGNSAFLNTICASCADGGNGAASGGAAVPGNNGIMLISYNNPAPISGTITNGAGTCGIATATVAPSGGTPAYTYTWSPTGGNAAASTGLTNGSYTVTIADANGCTGTASTTIVLPPALTVTATSTSVTCNGLSTGSATATASGGTAPYSIGINTTPPQGAIGTTFAASGLPAGSYTMGAQDAAGCQAIFPITITQPNPLTGSTAQTNVSCFGGANGSATVTPVGGTAPYTYVWSPIGGTSATASNLTAQNYTVSVTDAHNCAPTSITLAITPPALFTASITSFTNVSCFGLSDGSAVIGTVGGTSPYTYSGTDGAATNTASNLSQGNYTLTAIDANNCPATATVNITQPTVLTLTATATEPTCNGLSNGTATAVATGGTAPYSLGIIVPPQGGVTATGIETFNGLAAGTYSMGVQDAQGCQAVYAITISEPTLLTASISTSSNVSCFGLSDGNATAVGGNGTPGYTYSWLPSGGNAATANNLAANNYTVTVKDANLCTATTTVTITQPIALTASITTSRDDSCFNSNNGYAVAAAMGGTTPYQYNWLPSGGTNATTSNLAANTYTATVTDAHNCTTTTTVLISQPPVLIVSSIPQTICISQTATLTANAVGGNTAQSYTYSIAGMIGNIATVNPIVTTTYTLGVIDMKGCSDASTVIVNVRNPLSFIAVSPGAEACSGFSVNLNATGSGGDNTYFYTWNPGGIVGQNITVSPTSTTVYTVTITDNCFTPSVTATTTVTIDPLPIINFTSDKQKGCYPLCVQFTNSTSITPPENLTYSWILGEGHTSTDVNPYQCYSTAGILTVSLTATSSKGCISSSSIPNMITVYTHPKADFSSSPSNPTILDPLIQFTDASTPIGGIGISNTLWTTFGDGSDSTSTLPNPAHTYADTGTYCPKLVITNALGCKDSITQCIVIKPYFTLYIPNAFSPNNDGYNDIFNAVGDYVSEFDMRIFDRWGAVVYHSTNINYGWNGNSAEQGVYVYLVHATDSNRKTHTYKGTVTLLK